MTYQQELAETFSDMHKSLYGCRARWAYDMSEEELKRSIERLGEEIEYEWKREEIEREELAVQCHVSVEQIKEWEKTEFSSVFNVVDREFIEAIPVEPYEEYHSIELGIAA